MEYFAKDARETESIGREFAKTLKQGDIVAMFGDLGAGKTTFAKGIVSYLAPEERVTSPTFTLMREYEGIFPVYHFDMYRISGYDELYSTGYFDFAGKGLCIIEWSENIIDYIDEKAIKVYLEPVDDGRKIRIEGQKNDTCG